MCSITNESGGSVPGARLTKLIEHAREVNEAIAAELARSSADLASLHTDAVAAALRDALAMVDRGRASTAVLTGVVDQAVSARHLVEGTYASTRRFLEVEAGLSEQAARALTGRARDLADAVDAGDARVRDAWLAGDLTDDKVRELTLGIRTAVKRLPIAARDAATREAVDLLLPLSGSASVADLKRAVGRLRFVLDPDGIRQADLDAYSEQSLTCVPVGHLMRLQAFLDPAAAATVLTVLTVLEQQVDAWRRTDDLAGEDTLPTRVEPDSAEGRRLVRARTAHLRALALGELMTGLLGRGEVGMHHGVHPHAVVHVDARDLAAGLGGTLTMPGSDEPS